MSAFVETNDFWKPLCAKACAYVCHCRTPEDQQRYTSTSILVMRGVRKAQALWRGYQVRKSLWAAREEEEGTCACGDRATVCGECADCFWDNRERDRRLVWEERNGIIVRRFPCAGCGFIHRDRDLLALDGESYCEGCFQAAIDEWQEPSVRPAAVDDAEAKGNRYLRAPLHCCGHADCEGDCGKLYCGCEGKCSCDDEPLAAWRYEDCGAW